MKEERKDFLAALLIGIIFVCIAFWGFPELIRDKNRFNYEAIDLHGKRLKVYDYAHGYLEHKYNVGDTVRLHEIGNGIYRLKLPHDPINDDIVIITKLK